MANVHSDKPTLSSTNGGVDSRDKKRGSFTSIHLSVVLFASSAALFGVSLVLLLFLGECPSHPGVSNSTRFPCNSVNATQRPTGNEHTAANQRKQRSTSRVGRYASRMDCWRKHYHWITTRIPRECRNEPECVNFQNVKRIPRQYAWIPCLEPMWRSRRSVGNPPTSPAAPTTTQTNSGSATAFSGTSPATTASTTTADNSTVIIPSIARPTMVVTVLTTSGVTITATNTKAGATYRTNCEVDIWIYEWTNYKRVIGMSNLSGKEFLTMVLMRSGPQRRYYSGTLKPKGVVPRGRFGGYLRTMNNKRYIFIPRIIQTPDCTTQNSDVKVKARSHTFGSRYRVWEMFMNKRDGWSYISYDNVEFIHKIDEPNESAFISATLLKNFFKIVATPDGTASPEVETYLQVYQYLKDLQEPGRRSRRAISVPSYIPVSDINTDYNYNSLGFVNQNDCNSYLTGTKVFSGIEYFTGDDDNEEDKIYPVCKKVVDGDSCASLQRSNPGWFGCKWSAKACGMTVGQSRDDEQGSNSDVMKVSRINALMSAKASICADVMLNSGILKSERLTITNDINLNTQIGNLATNYRSTLGVIRSMLALREDDTLSTSQSFQDVNNNFQGLTNTTDQIQDSLNSTSSLLYQTTEVLESVVKEVNYIAKIRLKYLEDTVAEVLNYLTEIGVILHHPFVSNRTAPRHGNLDTLLAKAQVLSDAAMNHSKEAATYVKHHLRMINITFRNSSFISDQLDAQDKAAMRIIKDNQRAAAGLLNQSRHNKAEGEKAMNLSKSNDKTLESSMLGVEGGITGGLGDNLKDQVDNVGKIAVGGIAGSFALVFIILIVCVVIKCCKSS